MSELPILFSALILCSHSVLDVNTILWEIKSKLCPPLSFVRGMALTKSLLNYPGHVTSQSQHNIFRQ